MAYKKDLCGVWEMLILTLHTSNVVSSSCRNNQEEAKQAGHLKIDK